MAAAAAAGLKLCVCVCALLFSFGHFVAILFYIYLELLLPFTVRHLQRWGTSSSAAASMSERQNTLYEFIYMENM